MIVQLHIPMRPGPETLRAGGGRGVGVFSWIDGYRRLRQGRVLSWALATFAVTFLPQQAALATDVPFGPPSVLSTDDLAVYSVVAADVDGDGDADVLTASCEDNRVAWYENDGASPPGFTSRSITTNALCAVAVAAADLDGDGDTDALSSSLNDDKIAWYENDGASPPTWTERTVSLAVDQPYWVFAADVDGDGDTDALSASWADNKVAWYENDGASPPGWTARTITTSAIGAWVVFAADVDGDGDTDVLSASSEDSTIAWYENTGGSPPVWVARAISNDVLVPYMVFPADVDGDGDTDVLSASEGDATIAWHENNGASPPAWTERTIFTGGFPTAVFAADVDRDGDTDVLSSSGDAGSIAWHENLGGSPPTWTVHTISTAPINAFGVYAADLDDDGDADVLSGVIGANNTAWYENRTIHRSAAFPAPDVLPSSLPGPWSVRAADLDGDGDLDVVSAAGSNPPQVAWFENDGAANLGPQRAISTNATGVRSVFTADVDDDGDIDVLSASEFTFGNQIAWYENNGISPPSWTEHSISTLTQGARSVFAADLDRDGDMDVLSASFDDDTIAWYENNGASPPAWTRGVISTLADGARSVFAADIDQDGDLDVLSASEVNGNNKVAWYENDGASLLVWTERVVARPKVPQSVSAADLDNDGDQDLLVASAQDSTIAWYENHVPSTPAWTFHAISTTAAFALSASAADLDGDGDLDVLSASFNDDKVAWYENDGSVPPSWIERSVASTADGPAAAVAADLNGDGKPDVLSCSRNDNKVSWFPNRGGQFALVTREVLVPVWLPGATNTLLGVFPSHQGRAGDTALELATLELLFEEAPGDPLTSGEANALIEDLLVYLDDGDWTLGAGDVLVASVGTLSLASGRQTVTFADGDVNVRIAQGQERVYLVALHITAGAATQVPRAFRVTHLVESSSTAEDAVADIPLSLEAAINFSSGFINFPPLVVSVVPQDNALNVAVGTNVTVVFSEPVNPASLTPSTFRLLDPFGIAVPASVGLAPDGMTATLDPTPPGGALSFGSVHTAEVTGGVLDLAGLPAVPFTSRFATAPSPVTGTPLPTVSDQSVLPGPPPAPFSGGLSSASALSGSTVGPNLGFSVAPAGDLNHDGLSDFVGGAPGYAPGGMTEAGAAAIYLGSNAPEPSTGNHPREVADVIFTGRAPHDRAGTSVAAGFDFNGDGIGDILIGAEQVDRTVDPPEVTGAGRIYLIYFKPQEYDFDSDGIPDYLQRPEVIVSLAQVGIGISGAVLTGVSAGDQAGYAVAAGGLLETSDTREDIVIGAPGAGGGSGRVYVLFSSSAASATMSLANVGGTVPGVVYLGSAGERLGSSVALPGDVTPPLGPDIAMGAPLADTTQLDAGKVYVAAAGSLPEGTVNATSIPTQVHGDQACEELGFAVAGGGDNRADGEPTLPGGDFDLLIGAPYHDAVATPGNPCLDTTPVPNAGRVIQTTGRLAGTVIGASQVGSTIEGAIWRGVQAGGGLGWSVARLGDLSGNNLDDIGLGAPFSSPGMSGAGAVYVIEGSANTGPLGTIDADQVGQIVSGGIFLGTQFGEEAGLALCAAGDLDGDGLTGSPTADDFTVGSPGWEASLGTVHQVLGTLLQQPGECTALGCTVADLRTGAVLTVPPGALAQGTRFRFQVQGLPALPTSCGSHSLPGKSLVGSSDNSRTDCGTPPCPPPGFALRPAIEVPTRPELEYQLAQGEPLTLRYCDATFGWTAVPGGPAAGLVQDNSFVSGRKAVAASSVDTLRRYGVFVDDLDHDDARDTCDCSPEDASRWNVPGPAGTLLFGPQTPTSATLTWGPPSCMGGAPGALLYDTIRSSSPADFVTGAVCVETNGADTTSVDAADPPAGQGFYYIVSPENGCLSAPACSDSACVQPPARDC